MRDYLKEKNTLIQKAVDDAKAMEKADLIITIGLSFECWMNNFATSTSSEKTKLIEASKGIEARMQPAPDPHIWHDVQKVRKIIG